MLYELFNYLDQLDVPGAGVFKYVSFRSVMAFILALSSPRPSVDASLTACAAFRSAKPSVNWVSKVS